MPTETLLWLKQAVKLVVLPPNGLILLALTGLIVAYRRPVVGRRIVWVALLSLLLLSMPIVSSLMIRMMDDTPPLEVSKAANAQAIVILGGGVRPYAAEYGGPTLNGITLERVRYGARLARATGLPILVSGGAILDLPSEAAMMRDVLANEYHVPVRWVEARSHNTHENAVRSAVMLRFSGISRVVLVGHSFDFPRSRREFEAAGIQVIAAPIAIPSGADAVFGDFVPGIAGLHRSYYATYELLANVLYRVTH